MIVSFNWYQDLKNIYISIGIKNIKCFIFYWYQKSTRHFQLVSFGILKILFIFYWYHNISIYIFIINWYILNWYHKSDFIIFWYVLLICKGSLTSSLYIDSYLVYLILRSLTSLLYVLYVCRESFTSPFIHCILCVMWIRFSHLFFM